MISFTPITPVIHSLDLLRHQNDRLLADPMQEKEIGCLSYLDTEGWPAVAT